MNLNDFNDMTYAEYRLRSFGYYRQDEQDWLKVRKIAYTALIAPHSDPKKIAKTEKKFLPLSIDGLNVVNDETKNMALAERFKQEVLKYQQAIKAKSL